MKKGLKRAGLCFTLALVIRCCALLSGVPRKDGAEWMGNDFLTEADNIKNAELAGEYLGKILPKVKELTELTAAELKNMFPLE